jgi:hypothetical protein
LGHAQRIRTASSPDRFDEAEMSGRGKTSRRRPAA